jgi:hypothetical protein
VEFLQLDFSRVDSITGVLWGRARREDQLATENPAVWHSATRETNKAGNRRVTSMMFTDRPRTNKT